MHRVCSICLSACCFGFMSHTSQYQLNLSSGCCVSLKTDLMCGSIMENLLPSFFPCCATFFLPLRMYACNNLQPSTSKTSETGRRRLGLNGGSDPKHICVLNVLASVDLRKGVGLFPSGFCGGRIE